MAEISRLLTLVTLMQERVTGMDEKKETSTSNTKQSIGSCVKFVFSFIHLVFWSSPDLAARTPFRALLTSSPKHCALQLIAHCALISDIPAAQYGAEGGDESTASFGIAAKATEPVAVAVPALLFLSAAPTPQGSWRVLAPERERRGQGGGEKACGVCASSGGTCFSVRVNYGQTRCASRAVPALGHSEGQHCENEQGKGQWGDGGGEHGGSPITKFQTWSTLESTN